MYYYGNNNGYHHKKRESEFCYFQTRGFSFFKKEIIQNMIFAKKYTSGQSAIGYQPFTNKFLSNSWKNILSPYKLMKQLNKKYGNDLIILQVVYLNDTYPGEIKQKLLTPDELVDFCSRYKERFSQKQKPEIQFAKSDIVCLFQQNNSKLKQQIQPFQNFTSILQRRQSGFPLIAIKAKYKMRTDQGATIWPMKWFFFHNDQEDYITIYKNSAAFKLKKLNKELQLKVEKIHPSETIKQRFKVKNFSYGSFIDYDSWLQYYRNNDNYYKQDLFYYIFDLLEIQNQIIEKIKKDNKYYLRKQLFLRKADNVKAKLQMIAFLYSKVVVKMEVEIDDINKIIEGKNSKELFLMTDKTPKFFVHIINECRSNDIFSLNPWHRVQNFPLLNHQMLKDNIWLKNQFIYNCCIKLDFNQFKDRDKIRNYIESVRDFTSFDRHQIKQHFIVQDNLYSEKLTTQCKFKDIEDWDLKFQQILSNVAVKHKLTVSLIKYTLVYLKYNQSFQFDNYQILDILKEIKKNYPKHIDKYLLTLIELSIAEYITWKKENPLQVFKQYFNRMISNKSTLQLKKHFYMVNIKLTPNGIIFAGWVKQVRNKIVKQFSSFQNQFLKVDICENNFQKLSGAALFIETFVRNSLDKVKFLNLQYIPLAWSQSQLKQASLWYTLNNQDIQKKQRKQILQFLGQFNLIKNPALKAARIGQGFSASQSFDSSDFQIKFIQDTVAKGKKVEYIFTDGVGCASKEIFFQMKKKLKVNDLAAVQVRFKGIKGMISINNTLKGKQVIFRNAMSKYQNIHPSSDKYFDVINFSRYKVGYLNRQIIILLIANQIPQNRIIELQRQYLQQLQATKLQDIRQSLSFNQSKQRNLGNCQQNQDFFSLQSIQQIKKNSHYWKILQKQPYFQGILNQVKRKMIQKLKQKCHIKVQKSVRHIGIIDQFKVLEENQIYCSIKKQNSLKQNISGVVMITKNPCMHPADIRVVKCVSDDEIKKRLQRVGINSDAFQPLVNVIIFPQKGKVPLTCQISGSDLDGDEFFVSWDPRIIPYQSKPAFIVDQQIQFKQRPSKGADYSDMLDFFVQFMNSDKLGRLANSHLIHADQKGADCNECLKLCQVHNQAVDYPKKGINFTLNNDLLAHIYPHFMQKTFPQISYKSKSVLGNLYDQAKKQYEKHLKQQISKGSAIYDRLDLNLLKTYKRQQIQIALEYALIFKQQCKKMASLLQNQDQNVFTVFCQLSTSQSYDNLGLLQGIQFLRTQFLYTFLSEFQEQLNGRQLEQYYRQFSRQNQQKLPQNMMRKLKLWYFVSNYCFHQKANENVFTYNVQKQNSKFSSLPNFKEFYPRMQKLSNQKRSKDRKDYCVIGFTWFCLPKFMLKLMTQQEQKSQKNIDVQKQKEKDKRQQQSNSLLLLKQQIRSREENKKKNYFQKEQSQVSSRLSQYQQRMRQIQSRNQNKNIFDFMKKFF